VAIVTLGTFTDLVAYSVAVPVLPDLSQRLGASPTVIGLLFGSFGVTLLAVSVPAGVLSDRIGRRMPLVFGMTLLAGSTVLFAFSERLAWLFAARLMQGAADAVAWGVGFALIADLYGVQERGRVMGLVMSGSNLGFMIGPTMGGWLYETGGARLPFLVVAGLAAVTAVATLRLRLPQPSVDREPVKLGLLLRHAPVWSCAVAVSVASATISMLEPVMSLWLSTSLGLTPGRIGLVFGVGAVASTVLHPVYGWLADRYGGRPLMLLGLAAVGAVLPLLGQASTTAAVVALFVVTAGLVSLVVTPSLAYMAEAAAPTGVASFGASYGLYNVAWGAGLLGGPALGGVMFERLGFPTLTLVWPPVLVVAALLFARFGRKSAREWSI
jgi:multidrug resistance protein